MTLVPILSLYVQAEDVALDNSMVVMRAAFPPAFGEGWTLPQLRGMLDLPGSWMILAHARHYPAGFALVRRVIDEAELLLIAVHPQWRRQGIGRAMMDRVLQEINESKAKLLHIEVREGNEAVQFYNHYDFTLVGRRPAYYRGTDDTSHNALTFQRKV